VSRTLVDLTDLALAARSNDPRVVAAFGEGFPKARLHLPLAILEGIRNRPETALELGARLPIHWLRLDDSQKAVPVFTTLGQCRDCAERLDWETDHQSIRALAVPGDIALTYLTQALALPGVERAVLNPLSDAELHLARTEIEALAARQPLYSLWFYSRNGKLKRPVRFEGTSLLGSLLSKAEGVLDAWTDLGPPPIPIPVPDAPDALEHIGSQGPLGALASELYRIASEARVGTLDVTVTKRNGEIDIEAKPTPSSELLAALRAAAERTLSSQSGDARLSFRIDDASIVLSSSTAFDTRPAPTASRRPSPKRRYDYIPLEPEETSD
jgi:hypothetical protein